MTEAIGAEKGERTLASPIRQARSASAALACFGPTAARSITGRASPRRAEFEGMRSGGRRQIERADRTPFGLFPPPQGGRAALPPQASIVIRSFRIVGIIGDRSINGLVPSINRYIVTVRIGIGDKIAGYAVGLSLPGRIPCRACRARRGALTPTRKPGQHNPAIHLRDHCP